MVTQQHLSFSAFLISTLLRKSSMANRSIWITPEVERFLAICSSTPLASDLYRDMRLVASRQKGTEGVARIGVPPFLSFHIEEKAVYWHGPTDGIFYGPRILERALPMTWSLSVN
jgi:hypothetical protein